MERAEWLKQMRGKAEALYDHLSPDYWVRFGLDAAEMHCEYLQKFLGLVGQRGLILSAACGAGRFDGMLMEAGHSVVGIDQSVGMLARAREHFPPEQFPQVRYEKMGLQEMDFHEEFEGAICMDAMEHICPGHWLSGHSWFIRWHSSQPALAEGCWCAIYSSRLDCQQSLSRSARASAYG